MKKYFTQLHYKKELSALDRIVLFLLVIPAFFYEIAVKLRTLLYKKNILKTNKLDAFVISIGNLTTGGTGKTPTTAVIANYIASSLNKKTAILSHGYGGELSTSETNIISDGKNIFFKAHLAGDEPYWMASNIQGVPVLTGRNRYESGLKAIEEYGSEVFILDDGFQHIKLDRNLNLLIIDCHKKFGNNKLLPSGPLRESLSEIKRADKIIVVNKKPFNEVEKCNCNAYAEELNKRYKKPVFLCNFVTKNIYNIKTQKELEKGAMIYAFAGIAQPESFFNNLKQNSNVVATREYSDHHLYSKYDLDNIIKEAMQNSANAIVTTEKDAVKLKALIEDRNTGISIYALKLGLDLDIDALFKDINI